MGGGWGISVADALQRYRALSGTKPIWVTENGYKHTGAVAGHPVVTQRAAAKYLPRQILHHLSLGVPRFYVYQLYTEGSPENFGILNDDGTPRPAFTALKNLISLFKDPGPEFQPESLAYRLSTTSGIRHMLFQKRNGRFYLVLWQPVASSSGGYSDGSAADVEPAAKAVTITLPRVFSSVRTYQPSFRASAVKTRNGVARVGVAVPDHLLVVELVP